MAVHRFDVFLSYNRSERSVVLRIAERLRDAGLRVWIDVRRIAPGDDFQKEIAGGIAASAAFAYFVGPHGTGPWHGEEVRLAQDRAAKDRDFRLFAVLLPGAPEPFDDSILPPFLRMRCWLDLRAGIDDGIERGFRPFKSSRSRRWPR